jgi:general secretion pathway protein M
MSSDLKLWWSARTDREQKMLAFMVVVVSLFFLWFAVWQPLANGLRSAQSRYDRAVVDLATVKDKANTLKALRARPVQPLGVPVTSFVSQAASEAGFTLSRAEQAGTDGVAIAIVSAKSPALMAWLSNLEARGIFVSEISIRPNSDRTIAAEAVLKMRSES